MAAEEKKSSPKTGLIIGLLIIIIAILGAMLLKSKPEPAVEKEFVRPVKTYRIGDLEAISSWKYTGKLRPDEEVEMSFEVNGTVIELPTMKGRTVKAGDLLAQLDQRDFQNEIDAAKAQQARAEAYLERIKLAAEQNAVSQQDVDDAIALHEVAASELRIKEKALEDTSLYARFDGKVADTFVDQFQNVRAKQKILTLHDTSTMEVIANIAEQRVLFSTETETNDYRHTAVFDFIPNKEFELTLKEFSTEADPETQTYEATFTMPQPEDVMLLAGMSCTVHEYRKLEAAHQKDSGFLAPLSAVPIDSNGTYYVWKVRTEQGKTTTQRADVKVGRMSGNKILILDGVQNDELIAAAGVHFLREGQHVRLMK